MKSRPTPGRAFRICWLLMVFLFLLWLTQRSTDRLDKLIVLMESQAQYLRPATVPEAGPEKKTAKKTTEKTENSNSLGSSLFISKFSLGSLRFVAVLSLSENQSIFLFCTGSGLQEVSEYLRKIHEKQTAIGACVFVNLAPKETLLTGCSDMVSRQPFPQTSATSASAWGALLRSHMNNVEPIISQWRGTLDTLLIFVSLLLPMKIDSQIYRGSIFQRK